MRTAASQICCRMLLGEVRAGCDLDHLLVAALHRAVALPEVHEVALDVAQDLHLDVLGPRDVALEKDVGPAKRRRRFTARFSDLARQVLGPFDSADSAAAAAEARLDHQRVADPLRCRRDVVMLAEGLFGAWNRRHADGMREPPGGRLVAEGFELLDSRADEGDAGGFAGTRQADVLGEEPVARVDRIGAAALARRR